MSPFNLVWNSKRCYGCRTCELACSFHHKGVFSPELSSIRVSKANQTGKITWRRDLTCDTCEREEMPLCVKYCSYGALEAGRLP
jgi:Fe-S-cluster-containing hydrogenase component 2